jgi:hypothetical protein
MQPVEYSLFRNYHITLKQFLLSKCYLSRYPKDNNVKVEYITPSKAFAKVVLPVINGTVVNPFIGFRLVSIEQASGELPNTFATKYIKTSSGVDYVSREYRHPLVYRLNYGLNIYTSLQSDMDILLYQIMINTQHNKKGVMLLDGQYVEIGSDTPNDVTQTEPQEAQDKLIKYEITLKIPRAYLPFTTEDHHIIETIRVNYDLTNEIEDVT